MANLGNRIGKMILGTATLCCVIMYSVYFNNQSFYKSAIEINAPVIDCSSYSSESTDSDGKTSTTSRYTATVLYRDNSGKEYRRTFNNEIGSCVDLNGHIRVFYDPTNLEDCRLPAEDIAILHVFAGVAMSISLLIYLSIKDQ